ncbi:plasmid pRiA4b ORF-3 family protein [Chitinophaga silvisoli]|uniref:Plasmid pRiA4b ORF-3 family protein n=1 Tax=Chitinophaga silvisoli TaxID=2291814 RepID=A0A3E1P2M1_9BACT|nr:plasmid pRiA4b ORF-3 family protein [Chitinophaga silvisoli]RFM34436.1 plasmid pRiA4b ORF-3 family protein [Chitinophaga silvisoli]
MLYQFHISLTDSDPLIWRRIIVPVDLNLYQFHLAIQGAFGWENCHLFLFSKSGFSDKVCYGIPGDDINDGNIIEAKDVMVSQVIKKEGQKYCYIYDFGDKWYHQVILEKIEKDIIDFPYCLDGSGACPPEDIGGLSGYYYMLEILSKRSHPEKAMYKEMLGIGTGKKWDPGECNIKEINKRLVLLDRG